MNERLTTPNGQLENKVQEVSAVNDDFTNLLVATDIAMVLVDTELRIKHFTTPATQVLNVLRADVGRPIQGFKGNS